MKSVLSVCSWMLLAMLVTFALIVWLAFGVVLIQMSGVVCTIAGVTVILLWLLVVFATAMKVNI